MITCGRRAARARLARPVSAQSGATGLLCPVQEGRRFGDRASCKRFGVRAVVSSRVHVRARGASAGVRVHARSCHAPVVRPIQEVIILKFGVNLFFGG